MFILKQTAEREMLVAILNDGTYDGDGSLLDWTPIPVEDKELHTVTFRALAARRFDILKEQNEEGWIDLAEEDQYAERAFILEEDILTKLLTGAVKGEISRDSEAYAVNSALIGIFEEFAVRVVTK